MFIFPSYPHPYFVKESEKSERKIKRKGEQKKKGKKKFKGVVLRIVLLQFHIYYLRFVVNFFKPRFILNSIQRNGITELDGSETDLDKDRAGREPGPRQPDPQQLGAVNALA